MDDYGRIIAFLPNLKDFPISRDVGLGVGKKPITEGLNGVVAFAVIG